MSDLISREAICSECMIEKGGKGCWACLVNDAPTVDAFEVVRCKDCKHNYDDLVGLICVKGPCVDCIVPEDFYCSYGERNEVTK